MQPFQTRGYPLAKLFRYVIVGGMSGVIYTVVTTLLVAEFGLGSAMASAAGYCAAVPMSFLGHRRFSFRSRGRWTTEALRFVLAQVLNIAVAAGAMYGITSWLGSPYMWGMLAAVILVPVVNFAVMNYWVFRGATDPQRPAQREVSA